MIGIVEEFFNRFKKDLKRHAHTLSESKWPLITFSQACPK